MLSASHTIDSSEMAAVVATILEVNWRRKGFGRRAIHMIDRRNTYHIEVIGVDQGTPSLTGTTTLTVSILNSNDKLPYFVPATQRAEVNQFPLTSSCLRRNINIYYFYFVTSLLK